MEERIVVGTTNYLTSLRQAARDQGTGIHLLARFHRLADQAEDLFLGLPEGFDPLIGLGARDGIDALVYVQYLPEHPEPTFRAFVNSWSGDAVCLIGDDDPVELRVGELAHYPELRLKMDRILLGRIRPRSFPAPLHWLLDASLGAVTDELASSGLDDGTDAMWLARELFFRETARRLTTLRESHARAPLVRPVERTADGIGAEAQFLCELTWDELDPERLNPVLRSPSDDTWWWGSTGVSELEAMVTPAIDDVVEFLGGPYPQALESLRSVLGAFIRRVESFRDRDAIRQQKTYKSLLHSFAESRAATIEDGTVRLYGFRRGGEDGLTVVADHEVRPSADRTVLDLTTVPYIEDCDGVLWVSVPSDGRGWEAGFVEADGTSGQSTSDFELSIAFEAELFDWRMHAAMRHVQGVSVDDGDPVGVVEWIGRAALFDLVRQIEAPIPASDGADEDDVDTPTESQDEDSEPVDQSEYDEIADDMFARCISEVFGALINLIEQLPPPPDDPLENDAWWELAAQVMRDAAIDARWSEFPIDDLSVLWNVPVHEARWWGQDALAQVQARRIPGADESLLRCAIRAPRAVPQLLHRWDQVFGAVVPVHGDYILRRADAVMASLS